MITIIATYRAMNCKGKHISVPKDWVIVTKGKVRKDDMILNYFEKRFEPVDECEIDFDISDMGGAIIIRKRGLSTIIDNHQGTGQFFPDNDCIIEVNEDWDYRLITYNNEVEEKVTLEWEKYI